jgi:SAM-dependent methyltransferase
MKVSEKARADGERYTRFAMKAERTWFSATRKFLWSFHRRGVAATLQLGLTKLLPHLRRTAQAQQPHPFDLVHGVDTSGLVAGTDLFTGHKHDCYSTAYWGVSPSRARDILQRWCESLQKHSVEQFSFLDIGCGKGRMMLIASELPFKQVIGVELNTALAATASDNATKWQAAGFGRCPIQVLAQEATDTRLPATPCVIFLYNPFGAPVLRKMLAGFDRQLKDQPEDLEILYLNPESDEVMQEHDAYELIWQANFPQTDAAEPPDVVAPGWQPCSAYRYKRP